MHLAPVPSASVDFLAGIGAGFAEAGAGSGKKTWIEKFYDFLWFHDVGMKNFSFHFLRCQCGICRTFRIFHVINSFPPHFPAWFYLQLRSQVRRWKVPSLATPRRLSRPSCGRRPRSAWKSFGRTTSSPACWDLRDFGEILDLGGWWMAVVFSSKLKISWKILDVNVWKILRCWERCYFWQFCLAACTAAVCRFSHSLRTDICWGTDIRALWAQSALLGNPARHHHLSQTSH